MERMDYETPGLGTQSKCSLRFHQVTLLLVVLENKETKSNTIWKGRFGFQEQSTPKSSPRKHMESVLDVLYMDGKIRG
jgi:hypothetical protein